MHPYLPHLLGDIENAKQHHLPEEEPFGTSDMGSKLLDAEEDSNMDAHFEEVENYLSGKFITKSFGDYCGLKVADFPPAEQLSEEDMQIIIKAFEKMSITWNIDFDFPDTLPTHLYYKIMVNTLSEKTMIPKDGFATFDYCSGSPHECIFGEYCSCWKYWQEDDSEKSRL